MKWSRMTNQNINQSLTPSNLGSAGEIEGAGALCREAAHIPGTGLGVAGKEAAGLEELQARLSNIKTQLVGSVVAPGRYRIHNAV